MLLVLLVAVGHAEAQTQRPVSAFLGTNSLAPSVTRQVMPALSGPDAANVRGIVDVEVVVDRSGRVQFPRIRNGLGGAVDAGVLTAVREWRFRAARKGDQTVAVLVVVRFEFVAPVAAELPAVVTATLRRLPAEPLAPQSSPINANNGKDGIELPRMRRSIQPPYTPEAMRERIQGFVELEVVVLADGTVGSARVIKSLDDKLGLDRQALIAARYWIFEPARRDGTPIAQVVVIEFAFRIH
jgi:TonB family protein